MTDYLVWRKGHKDDVYPEKWNAIDFSKEAMDKHRYGQVTSFQEAPPGHLAAKFLLQPEDENMSFDLLIKKYPCPR